MTLGTFYLAVSYLVGGWPQIWTDSPNLARNLAMITVVAVPIFALFAIFALLATVATFTEQ